MNYIDENSGLCFEYPSNWELQLDKNLLTLFNANNGVGVMQCSVYAIPSVHGFVVGEQLSQYLKNNGYDEFVISNNGNVSYSSIVRDGFFWRYWLFLIKSNLVLISYNCEYEDRFKEESIVQRIIESVLSSSNFLI